jgi:hypothetical protein
MTATRPPTAEALTEAHVDLHIVHSLLAVAHEKTWDAVEDGHRGAATVLERIDAALEALELALDRYEDDLTPTPAGNDPTTMH